MLIKVMAVALLLAAQAAPAPETLNNDSVVTLVRAGLGPEAIVAKINGSSSSFDTSTDSLVRLKQAGVPDPVIAAMLRKSTTLVSSSAAATSNSADPLAPHASGVYLLDSTASPSRMVRIDPTVSNQMKTSGTLGFAFSYGLAKMKMKAVIPNATARVQIASARPTFYFYFDQNPAFANLGLTGGFGFAMTSPNEFSLVRLEAKKDHREAAVGAFNIGGAQIGVQDKARSGFTYSDVAPGVFKVEVTQDLPPGEYGFLHSVSGATGMAGTARIFDFAVVTEPQAGAPRQGARH
jgi:hypothetical protein